MFSCYSSELDGEMIETIVNFPFKILAVESNFLKLIFAQFKLELELLAFHICCAEICCYLIFCTHIEEGKRQSYYSVSFPFFPLGDNTT